MDLSIDVEPDTSIQDERGQCQNASSRKSVDTILLLHQFNALQMLKMESGSFLFAHRRRTLYPYVPC